MRRPDLSDDAGVTLLEVLIVLVILTLLVTTVAVVLPPGQGNARPGAEAASAFIASARATAISSDAPVWLSVWHDRIVEGSTTRDLAPATLLAAPEGGPALEGGILLVRPDGVIVGPRIWVAAQGGARELFVWNAGGVAAP